MAQAKRPYGLDEEQLDSLRDLLSADGWEPLALLLDRIQREIEANVLRYDLSRGADLLVIEKARAEGAALFKQRLLEARKAALSPDKKP